MGADASMDCKLVEGQIETKIGDVIEHDGKKIKCIEDLSKVCTDCFFDNNIDACCNQICDSCLRDDKKSVMFIKVKE